MKLAINIAGDGTPGFYTSLDVVTGVVSLDIKRSVSITLLEVILKASVFSHNPVDPFDYGYALLPLPIHHKVFSTSLVLFPTFPLGTSTRYTIGKGGHQFKFDIDLCLLSYCMEFAVRGSATLERAYRRTGRIVYSIQAASQERRPFGRRVSQKMEFMSMRMEPPRNSPCFTPGTTRTIKFLPRAVLDITTLTDVSPRGDQLPPYSPTIILGANTSIGTTSQDSNYVSLELYFTIPGILADSLKAVLKSIRISFINVENPTKLCKQGLTLTTIIIQHIRLDLRLQAARNEEVVYIDAALWHHRITIPSELLPSTNQTRGETQSLQVLYEFSSDKSPCTTFATLLIPIKPCATNSPPSPGY